MNKHIPNPCADWAEKIAATHPNDLSAFEQKALKRHVESCSACASTLANYLMMDVQLRGSFKIEPLPGLPPQLLQIWKEQECQRATHNLKRMPFFYALLAYSLVITGIGVYAIYRNFVRVATWIPIIVVATIITIGGGLLVTTRITNNEDHRYKRQSGSRLKKYKLLLLAFFLSIMASVPPLLTLINYTGVAPATSVTPASPSLNMWTLNIGMPILSDPLSDDSRGYWTTFSTSAGSCLFASDSYHVTATGNDGLSTCFASSSFTDFVFEVKMTFVSGHGAGIIFRANSRQHGFYYFEISQEGNYVLYIFDTRAPFGHILTGGSSPAIKAGPGQSNRIGVVAMRHWLGLYVNQQKIYNINDSTYSNGEIGFATGGWGASGVATFSNANVWTWTG